MLIMMGDGNDDNDHDEQDDDDNDNVSAVLHSTVAKIPVREFVRLEMIQDVLLEFHFQGSPKWCALNVVHDHARDHSCLRLESNTKT